MASGETTFHPSWLRQRLRLMYLGNYSGVAVSLRYGDNPIALCVYEETRIFNALQRPPYDIRPDVDPIVFGSKFHW